MAQLKLMKKEWFDWFKGTTLDNITAWTEYYYINPDSQHWISNYQLWDEEWELGSLDINTGLPLSVTTRIRAKNKIKVTPNGTYYGKIGSGSMYVLEYDINGNYLGTYFNATNRTFTTSLQTAYIWCYCDNTYGATYKHDICINESNPTFNGHYEPRIIKIEDILGIVDLGTLSWSYRAESTRGPYFLTRFVGPKINPFYGAVKSKYFIVDYETVTNTIELLDRDKIVTSDYNPDAPDMAYVLIKDSRYTDAVAFKQAMSGKYLIYLKNDSPLG